MGRSPKDIKWETVLLRMQARNSARQIAQAHHINIDTFYDRFKEEFGCNFSDYSDGEQESGEGNIAYVQYTKALSGNVQMLTLLGEEWLGQGAPKNRGDAPLEELLLLKAENSRLRYQLKKKDAQPNDEPEAG